MSENLDQDVKTRNELIELKRNISSGVLTLAPRETEGLAILQYLYPEHSIEVLKTVVVYASQHVSGTSDSSGLLDVCVKLMIQKNDFNVVDVLSSLQVDNSTTANDALSCDSVGSMGPAPSINEPCNHRALTEITRPQRESQLQVSHTAEAGSSRSSSLDMPETISSAGGWPETKNTNKPSVSVSTDPQKELAIPQLQQQITRPGAVNIIPESCQSSLKSMDKSCEAEKHPSSGTASQENESNASMTSSMQDSLDDSSSEVKVQGGVLLDSPKHNLSEIKTRAEAFSGGHCDEKSDVATNELGLEFQGTSTSSRRVYEVVEVDDSSSDSLPDIAFDAPSMPQPEAKTEPGSNNLPDTSINTSSSLHAKAKTEVLGKEQRGFAGGKSDRTLRLLLASQNLLESKEKYLSDLSDESSNGAETLPLITSPKKRCSAVEEGASNFPEGLSGLNTSLVPQSEAKAEPCNDYVPDDNSYSHAESKTEGLEKEPHGGAEVDFAGSTTVVSLLDSQNSVGSDGSDLPDVPEIFSQTKNTEKSSDPIKFGTDRIQATSCIKSEEKRQISPSCRKRTASKPDTRKCSQKAEQVRRPAGGKSDKTLRLLLASQNLLKSKEKYLLELSDESSNEAETLPVITSPKKRCLAVKEGASNIPERSHHSTTSVCLSDSSTSSVKYLGKKSGFTVDKTFATASGTLHEQESMECQDEPGSDVECARPSNFPSSSMDVDTETVPISEPQRNYSQLHEKRDPKSTFPSSPLGNSLIESASKPFRFSPTKHKSYNTDSSSEPLRNDIETVFTSSNPNRFSSPTKSQTNLKEATSSFPNTVTNQERNNTQTSFTPISSNITSQGDMVSGSGATIASSLVPGTGSDSEFRKRLNDFDARLAGLTGELENMEKNIRKSITGTPLPSHPKSSLLPCVQPGSSSAKTGMNGGGVTVSAASHDVTAGTAQKNSGLCEENSEKADKIGIVHEIMNLTPPSSVAKKSGCRATSSVSHSQDMTTDNVISLVDSVLSNERADKTQIVHEIMNLTPPKASLFPSNPGVKRQPFPTMCKPAKGSGLSEKEREERAELVDEIMNSTTSKSSFSHTNSALRRTNSFPTSRNPKTGSVLLDEEMEEETPEEADLGDELMGMRRQKSNIFPKPAVTAPKRSAINSGLFQDQYRAELAEGMLGVKIVKSSRTTNIDLTKTKAVSTTSDQRNNSTGLLQRLNSSPCKQNSPIVQPSKFKASLSTPTVSASLSSVSSVPDEGRKVPVIRRARLGVTSTITSTSQTATNVKNTNQTVTTVTNTKQTATAAFPVPTNNAFVRDNISNTKQTGPTSSIVKPSKFKPSPTKSASENLPQSARVGDPRRLTTAQRVNDVNITVPDVTAEGKASAAPFPYTYPAGSDSRSRSLGATATVTTADAVSGQEEPGDLILPLINARGNKALEEVIQDLFLDQAASIYHRLALALEHPDPVPADTAQSLDGVTDGLPVPEPGRAGRALTAEARRRAAISSDSSVEVLEDSPDSVVITGVTPSAAVDVERDTPGTSAMPPAVAAGQLDFGVQKVLEVFPWMQADRIKAVLQRYTPGNSLDQAINLTMEYLLDNPPTVVHPPQPPPQAPPQQREITEVHVQETSKKDKIDYYENYKESASTVPSSVTADRLSVEFRYVRMGTIHYLLKKFNGHYAPVYRCLRNAIDEAVDNTQGKQCSKPTSITVKLHEGEDKTDAVRHNLLKVPRSFDKLRLHDDQKSLQKEVDFVKQRTQADKEEFDRKVAWLLLETEYEEEGQAIECGCCYTEQPFENLVQCFDGHLFCQQCLVGYAREAVYGQGKLSLVCMTDDCDATFPKSQLVKALPEEMLEKYEERVAEENLNKAAMPDLVRCPHCNIAVVLEVQVMNFKCPNSQCRKETCRKCKEDWSIHRGKTCEQMEKKDETKLRLSYEEKMTAAYVRACPSCQAQFTKESGCNKMVCRCGAKMCYICREPNINYSHFCQHPRDPGKDCTICKSCSLWTNSSEDEKRAIAEIQREAQEKRKEQGFLDDKIIGVPEGPPPPKKHKSKRP